MLFRSNFFHVLRRQLKRDFRKPLVVFTPKSLLRQPRCVSSLDDLADGKFQELIDDGTVDAAAVTRVVFCSGKIYYELLEYKEKNQLNQVAIVRLEQLYPFPAAQMEQVVKKYKSAKTWCWVQEEPKNMGAWSYLLRTVKGVALKIISREESASPATGSHHAHEREQRELIRRAFDE